MEIPKGYDICAHCNGYGSSLLDPIGVNRCTVCSDSEHLGLVKIEVKDEHKEVTK